MATNPYIALIAIPIVVGLVNLILPRVLQKILTLLGVGVTGFLTLMLALNPEFFEFIFEVPYFGLDKLGLFALVGMQILALIILLFTLKGVNPEIERSFYMELRRRGKNVEGSTTKRRRKETFKSIIGT